MKYRSSQSKASLFLIELLIVIAFFSVSSVVCIRLFVHAHIVSMESRNLSHAVIAAQGAAESFKAAAGEPQAIARLIGGHLEAGNTVVAYYDKNWAPVSEFNGDGFKLSVSLYDEEHLLTAEIEVNKAADESGIYSLYAKHLIR